MKPEAAVICLGPKTPILYPGSSTPLNPAAPKHES